MWSDQFRSLRLYSLSVRCSLFFFFFFNFASHATLVVSPVSWVHTNKLTSHKFNIANTNPYRLQLLVYRNKYLFSAGIEPTTRCTRVIAQPLNQPSYRSLKKVVRTIVPTIKVTTALVKCVYIVGPPIVSIIVIRNFFQFAFMLSLTDWLTKI